MSFQAYLDNIQQKTGLTLNQFRELAQTKGFLFEGKVKSDIKASQITNWLKADFDLGHGHEMAIYAYLKGKEI